MVKRQEKKKADKQRNQKIVFLKLRSFLYKILLFLSIFLWFFVLLQQFTCTWICLCWGLCSWWAMVACLLFRCCNFVILGFFNERVFPRLKSLSLWTGVSSLPPASRSPFYFCWCFFLHFLTVNRIRNKAAKNHLNLISFPFVVSLIIIFLESEQIWLAYCGSISSFH